MRRGGLCLRRRFQTHKGDGCAGDNAAALIDTNNFYIAKEYGLYLEQLGQAERDLTNAVAARDLLAAEIASTNVHRELATLGERLSAAQSAVALLR